MLDAEDGYVLWTAIWKGMPCGISELHVPVLIIGDLSVG